MHTIHSDLRRVDLNLLVAFDALARQGSVTHAAEELGLTQSAMSHALRRIRSLLGDEVAVRTSKGLVLTPRAEALVAPVRTVLEDLSRLLQTPEAFRPEESKRTFRLAAPDLVELLLLPGLLKVTSSAAPFINLAVVPMPEHPEEALQTGELDLAVLPGLVGSDAPFGPSAAPHLKQRLLQRDTFTAYVSKTHPLTRVPSLTLERLVETPHLLVSPTGAGPGPVDTLLEQAGKSRRVGLRVPSFSTALAVLPGSDLLLIGPTALGKLSAAKSLVQMPVPLRLPEQAIGLVWHPRFAADAGHVWLRNTIEQVMAKIRA